MGNRSKNGCEENSWRLGYYSLTSERGWEPGPAWQQEQWTAGERGGGNLGGRRDGGWGVAWPREGVWSLQLDGQQWPENEAGARICRVDDDELGFVMGSIPVLTSRPASRKLSVSLAYRFRSFFSGDIELLGSQLLSPLTLGERWPMLCKRPCIVK